MRKSFKTIDVGYSTELESSLFQAFENNDEYTKNLYDNCYPYIYIYQHTGSIPFSSASDLAEFKTINLSPTFTFKNNHLYIIEFRVRTYTISNVSSTFGGGYLDLQVYPETDPQSSWSLDTGKSLYINSVGFYNGVQHSGYFYVRDGVEDFDTKMIFGIRAWSVTIPSETFSGTLDSYDGSPIELTIQDAGPLRTWV
jgi:hypothetical protein